MPIKVLPDHLVNQISAGEVIERPASVVRELVDNAIDAGAGEISIYLEEGGRNLIRVYDDGCGMERDEAILAFERHATSKLSTVADLTNISTLGFRGEALPSIASVAKVNMRTRTKSSDTAFNICFEGGTFKGAQPCAAPGGTDIEVRRLFYNTPVRRKFLREPRSEELRVKQWVIQSSLARPQVRYRLFADNREILNLPRRESAIHRAQAVFRGGTAPIEFERNGIKVSGLIGHPAQAQADAKSFVIFVNGRLVSDRALLRAVKDGFGGSLKDREFPVGFINIELAHRLVDVNVHPQKSEVRFRFPQEVFITARTGVQEAVRSFRQPFTAADNSRPLFLLKSSHIAEEPTWSLATNEGNAAVAFHPPATEMLQQPISTPQELPKPPAIKFSDLRFIGQVLGCYLICEDDQSMVIVDMHAAHERCNYNKVREIYRDQEAQAQELLLAEVIEVGEERANALIAQEDILIRFGFRVEMDGGTSVRVSRAPTIVPPAEVGPLIKELAALACEIPLGGKLETLIDSIAARIACHASIRSGDGLRAREAQALFKLLDQAETGGACPHGRPVAIRIDKSRLEGWFGRRD